LTNCSNTALDRANAITW